jgi:hypothetical protein
LLDGTGLLGIDPTTGDVLPVEPPRLAAATIAGRVWADTNGNRVLDGSEVGMAGVRVYSDLNFNGRLDADEPRAETSRDNPATDFDEGGFYRLVSLQPGYHTVRQMVPEGHEQTFPSLRPGYLPPPWGDATVHVVLADAGATVDQIDFGNQPIRPGAVAGRKWEDRNGNGVQDENEPGLAGVTIYSDRNFNGQLDADEPHVITRRDNPETDFDEGGLYVLSGLEPGHHAIAEVVPDGFLQTFPEPLIYPLATDAHNGIPGQIGDDGQFFPLPWPQGAHHVHIVSGATISELDFGNQKIEPGGVQGRKWEDLNGDGTRNAGEPGLPGVIIYSDLNFNGVLDDNEPHTRTRADLPETDFDEGGLYVLAGLQPGYHKISEVVPAGFQQTYPLDIFLPAEPLPGVPGDALVAPAIYPWFPGSHFVRIASGGAVDGLDFGNQRIEPGKIVGVKWEDLDGDGQRDSDERGLANVTIYADLNFNGRFDANEPSAITTADDPNTQANEAGRYRLTGLRPGMYLIREVVPEGYRQTFPHGPHPWWGDPNFDPATADMAAWDQWLDVLPASEGGHVVWLGSGQVVEGIHFGNQPRRPGSLEGVKWLDANGNRERDPHERGLPGVTIYLDRNDNGRLDLGERFTRTTADNPDTDFDEGGRYRFDHLEAGVYVVREVVPDGFRQTYPLAPLPWPVDPLPPQLDPNQPGGTAGDPSTGTDPVTVDPFATIRPERILVTVPAGEPFFTEIAVTIHPSIFREIEIDLVARNHEPWFQNLSGPQPNGGTGDTSKFEVMILSEGRGDLVIDAIDLIDGSVLASVPVVVRPPTDLPGAHRVYVEPGQHVSGIDFGNQYVDGTTDPPPRDHLPGDHNGDGVVDQYDLDQWSGQLGTAVLPGSDANEMPQAGGRGFLQWQRSFGMSASPTANGYVTDLTLQTRASRPDVAPRRRASDFSAVDTALEATLHPGYLAPTEVDRSSAASLAQRGEYDPPRARWAVIEHDDGADLTTAIDAAITQI